MAVADSIVQLLGSKLTSSSGEQVATTDRLNGAKRVGLYFSAHWCPPCRAFTPKLSAWASKHAANEGAVLVFLSLDRDTKSFTDYLSSMSWNLAVPLKDSHIQAAADRYNVEGIPSLIWLDAATGATITDKGVEKLSRSPDSAWPFGAAPGGRSSSAPSGGKGGQQLTGLWALLGDSKLVDASGRSRTAAEVRSSTKSIGLYFSAHWCPPCRGFTPQLADWYRSHAASTGCEIIFVSADRSASAFTDYLGEMPWAAVPFSDSSVRDELSSHYEVSGIPSLITVDSATGETVCKDARGFVGSDPEGWPWAGKGAPEEGGCSVQ